MERLRTALKTAGMGASFGLAFFGLEEWLHWALRAPNLRWSQLFQLLPFYALVGALVGALIGAAGIEGLAAALWLWAAYTALLALGHAVAAMGWVGAPMVLVGMLAVVVLLLFITRERGDEYRWGALVGGWMVTLFGLVLNTSRLGDFLNPVTLATNAGVLVIGGLMSVAIAKALGHRRPRAGVWAFLFAVVLWTGKSFLPNPAARDLPKPPKKAKNVKQGVSVVVVMADGLRTDRVGLFTAPERSATPHLDALASRSISYPEAQAAAPWGMPAMASAFTGLYPVHHETGVGQPLGTDKRTLAEYLSEEADYTTAMVVSKGEYRPGMGLDQGFDWYKRVTGLGHTPVLVETIDLFGVPILAERGWPRAERITERVLQFTQSRKGTRWLVVAQYSDLLTDDPAEYEVGLRHLDAEIGRLAEAVSDETWIVVVGTHGNALGHPGGQESVWNENVRVPLIVLRPYNLKPVIIPRPVSTADLLPTLLNITESGVVPRIRLDGGVLEEAAGMNSPTEHPAILSQGSAAAAIRDGEFKLIEPADGSPDQLYDVVTDPTEDQDLVSTNPERADALGWLLPWREKPPVAEPETDEALPAEPDEASPNEEPEPQ